MAQIKISNEERRLLMGYKRQAPHLMMQARAEAILLLVEDVPTAVISRFVDRAESTVKEWAREWNRERMSSIFTGHAGNLNASKLTTEQRAEVARVLSEPPSARGLPEQFWTVPDLATWLKTRFDVVYESATSYHFLLRMAGLSFHKPEPFDRRRADDAVIEAKVAQIRQDIAKDLADPDTLVYAADEVRIDQEAIVRRAWYAKNTKTKLLVNRERESQNYIGFLDQNTGTCELIRLQWQNGPLILDALTQLVAAHPGKKITIVWDNAPWHKTKVIRDELGEQGKLASIRFLAFPPYAPDHNPIEHVWGETKTSISNIQHETFDHTRAAFEATITDQTHPYRI